MGIVGIVGILIGGPKSDPKYAKPTDVTDMLLGTAFLAYASTVSLVFGLIAVLRWYPEALHTCLNNERLRAAAKLAGMALPGICASFNTAFLKVTNHLCR